MRQRWQRVLTTRRGSQKKGKLQYPTSPRQQVPNHPPPRSASADPEDVRLTDGCWARNRDPADSVSPRAPPRRRACSLPSWQNASNASKNASCERHRPAGRRKPLGSCCECDRPAAQPETQASARATPGPTLPADAGDLARPLAAGVAPPLAAVAAPPRAWHRPAVADLAAHGLRHDDGVVLADLLAVGGKIAGTLDDPGLIGLAVDRRPISMTAAFPNVCGGGSEVDEQEGAQQAHHDGHANAKD